MKQNDANNIMQHPTGLMDRFRGYRRQLVKQTGKTLLRTMGRFIAGQSLIGNQPVYAPDIFPWTATLESNWETIRSELDAVLRKPDDLPAFHQISPDQWRISTGDSWKTLILYVLGDRIDANCARCPETVRLLEQVPNLRNAWFSILAPGYRIPPHQGPTNGIIRIHLGLIVPRDSDSCRIRVANQVFGWQEGKCVVFDDFYEHEAWNNTEEQRAVLFFDVDRPLRLPGRILNRLLIAIMKRTAYVQDAHTNLLQWEQHHPTREYDRDAA
ncbi:MAG: aspartyl/asparaginyl beta-hydroxylase domain-containing protein [Thiohalobacterales bacterium]